MRREEIESENREEEMLAHNLSGSAKKYRKQQKQRLAESGKRRQYQRQHRLAASWHHESGHENTTMAAYLSWQKPGLPAA
jgi:type I site-specific restriction-modification system R (restriction) subunit